MNINFKLDHMTVKNISIQISLYFNISLLTEKRYNLFQNSANQKPTFYLKINLLFHMASNTYHFVSLKQ